MTPQAARTGRLTLDVRVANAPGDAMAITVPITVSTAAPLPVVAVPSGFGAGRDAFVTAIYVDGLARLPEPSGLRFWSGRLAAGVSPQVVGAAIYGSSEHQALARQGLAPPVGLSRALADGLQSARRASPAARSSGRLVGRYRVMQG